MKRLIGAAVVTAGLVLGSTSGALANENHLGLETKDLKLNTAQIMDDPPDPGNPDPKPDPKPDPGPKPKPQPQPDNGNGAPKPPVEKPKCVKKWTMLLEIPAMPPFLPVDLGLLGLAEPGQCKDDKDKKPEGGMPGMPEIPIPGLG